MKSYKELSRDELLELQGALNKEYADAKSKGLSLNMARGKPSPEQLGFSMGIMDVLNSSSELVSEDGTGRYSGSKKTYGGYGRNKE